MTIKTTITDKEACLIAKKYVWQEYFAAVGEPIYIWEEGNDEDIGGAQSCSGHAPPNDKLCRTFLISDVKTTAAEVVLRDNEQIQVNVHCTAFQCEGSSEDDEGEDDEFYEAERIVFCYLEPDEEGNWLVENAEE